MRISRYALVLALGCTSAVEVGQKEASLEQEGVIPSYATLPETPSHLELELLAGPLSLEDGPRGPVIRESGSYRSRSGAPGEPDITERIVDVLVPYDADLQTLRVTFLKKTEEPAGMVPPPAPVGRRATTDPDSIADRVEPAPLLNALG